LRNAAAHHAKQRVRARALQFAELSEPLRIADSQFPEQVLPFELELSARNREPAERASPSDSLGRKRIAARHCFLVHDAQVLGNATDRRIVCAEPQQLRVMSIPLRLASQHSLRKKRFAPESDESSSIEVLRMQTPDPH